MSVTKFDLHRFAKTVSCKRTTDPAPHVSGGEERSGGVGSETRFITACPQIELDFVLQISSCTGFAQRVE